MNPGPSGVEVIGAGFTALFSFIYLLAFVFFIVMAVAVLIGNIFWIFMIIDVTRREFPDPNMKTMWLVVVIMGSIIGAIIYHYAGKPQGTLRT